MSHEKKLIRELMDNYRQTGINGRPVYNYSDVVPVEFGVGLIQMDLDEKYKVLKLSMWSRLVS